MILLSLFLGKKSQTKKPKSMNDTIFKHLGGAFIDIATKVHAMIAGTIGAIFSFMMPVKDIVNLLLFLFAMDVIFGYWAAKRLRGERFSVKIIWNHTIPRMLISITLITGAFMWDKVYGQNLINTCKIIGWFISGVLLYSIAENGYSITKWAIFPKISTIVQRKIKDMTKIDVSDIEKKKS